MFHKIIGSTLTAIVYRIGVTRAISRAPFVMMMGLLISVQPLGAASLSVPPQPPVIAPHTLPIPAPFASSPLAPAPRAPLLNLDNIEMREETLPAGTAGMMAEYVADAEGAVYLLGGYRTDPNTAALQLSTDIWRYNPVRDRMSVIGQLPVGLALAAHVYVPEAGLIYLFGGIEQNGGSIVESTAIRIYNVNTGELTTLPNPTLSARVRGSAAFVRSLNKIFVFGGVNTVLPLTPGTTNDGTYFSYDLTSGAIQTGNLPSISEPSNIWTGAYYMPLSYPNVLNPEEQTKTTVLASNYILVLGTRGYAIFDPVTRTFPDAKSSITNNRILGAAVAFVPGLTRFWVAGGYGSLNVDVNCWKTEISTADTQVALNAIPLTGNPGSAADVIAGTQNDASAVYVPQLDRVLMFGGFLAPSTNESDLYCGEGRWPDAPKATTYSRAIYSVSPEYNQVSPDPSPSALGPSTITNPVIGTPLDITVARANTQESFAVAIQAAYKTGQSDALELRIVKMVTETTPASAQVQLSIMIPEDISPALDERSKQVLGICVLSLTRPTLPPNCSEIGVTMKPGNLKGTITRVITDTLGQAQIQPVFGAELELRDADNGLVTTTLTLVDGSYDFCGGGSFCLAIGQYTLNISKKYVSSEFPDLNARFIHLPQAVAVEVQPALAVTQNATLQVTRVLGPTVKALQAKHNKRLGDTIGTFLAFDHLKGKAGVPTLPVVTNTFTVETQDFGPGFPTAQVKFELNNASILGTKNPDGSYSAVIDLTPELISGTNRLRVTAYDNQNPPLATSRDFVVKAVRAKPIIPITGTVASYINLVSIVWNPIRETYMTRVLVPSGFRWPENPPYALDLKLFSLYSRVSADVEILDEYNLTDWNSNGSGGILMQLLSPSRDEGIFGPKFKVTTPFDPNTGYDAFVVRAPPINLCLFGLPKCGKWIRIYGVAFKKSFELGPASASIDLTVGIFGQYRANLLIQGRLRGDNYQIEEIRFIPQPNIGLGAGLTATVQGKVKMPAFIPDISFSIGAGAMLEAWLAYNQPIVYKPERSPTTYLDTPCVNFRATAEAWFKVKFFTFRTPKWDIVNVDVPSGCTRQINGVATVALGTQAANADTIPDLMPLPVTAISTPNRYALMRLWVDKKTDLPAETETDLAFKYQDNDTVPFNGHIAASVGAMDPAVAFITKDLVHSDLQALAVWSQINPAIAITANSGLTATLAAQEIYAAFWKVAGGWNAPIRLTTNAVSDGRPVLASNPATGEVLVAWVRDADGNPQTMGDLSIVTRHWSGSVWDAEQIVAHQAGSADMEPAIAYSTDGSQAWVVWARDHDAAYATNPDRHLNYAVWNGSTWSAPTEPSTWPSGAISPRLIFSSISSKPLVVMLARTDPGPDEEGRPGGAAGIGVGNRLYAAWWGASATDWNVQAVGDTRAESPQVMLVSDDRALILLRSFGSGDNDPASRGRVAAAEGELNPSSARWVSPGPLTVGDTPIWQISGMSIPLTGPNDGSFGLNMMAVQENVDLPVNRSRALSPSAPAVVQTAEHVTAQFVGGTASTGVLELNPATNGVNLAVEDVSASNPRPVMGELVTITARIRSKTVRPMTEAGNTHVDMFLYVNHFANQPDWLDVTAYDGELLFNESYTFTLHYRSSGKPENVMAELQYQGDLNKNDNDGFLQVGALPPPQVAQAQSTHAQASNAGLSWSPPVSDTGHYWTYRIYRGPTADGPWTPIGYSAVPAYTDLTPSASELYYAIEAMDENNRRSQKSMVTLIPAPVADFSAGTTNGKGPLTVGFTNSSTGTATRWEWDFGDAETSIEQHPTHVFNQAGVYKVMLTAIGPGGSDTMTRLSYITVTGLRSVFMPYTLRR